MNTPKIKLERTFVREEAYTLLRNWIVEGKFEPGKKLRDKELAEELGVSRTPIREALLRLENEGLVQTKPNSSTIVAPIDLHKAFYLYSIVWSLERLALEQALPSLTEEHIALMTKLNKTLSKAIKNNDIFLAFQADYDFHWVYVELSGNNELQQILTTIKQKLRRIDLHYFKQTKDAHLSVKEHESILSALKKRDLSLALDAIESNWKACLERIPIKKTDKK